MSNDGKMEKSFVSFKAAHPEWMPADPTGSLYLSRIADLSARRHADDHTPRPGSASIVIPPAGRVREYERALQESQSAAVRRRGGGSGFGSASMMLGQTSVYQSGMAQSIALGDSDGSIALAQLQAPAQGDHPTITTTTTTATHGPTSIPSGSGELAVDSESALGEPYVDGARRHARGGVARSMQEEEEELGTDGGVLGLLTQIYNGGGGSRGVLQRR
jgi:autophagy-related protein 9